MKLTIDITPSIEELLHRQLGPNLEQAAKEALAASWYQAEKLSMGQVAEFLGVTVYEAEGVMKLHHVAAPYALEDFEHDRDTLRRVLDT